jgi:hypothetical protein
MTLYLGEMEHPYPTGTLVKVRTIYMVINGSFMAMGHRRADHVYWNPDWASTDIGRVIGPGREGDGLLMGMVLGSQDASLLRPIPEPYKGEPRYTIYLVLIGDDPPLWFPWSDIEPLSEGDHEPKG